jgi:hypothetical protein
MRESQKPSKRRLGAAPTEASVIDAGDVERSRSSRVGIDLRDVDPKDAGREQSSAGQVFLEWSVVGFRLLRLSGIVAFVHAFLVS